MTAREEYVDKMTLQALSAAQQVLLLIPFIRFSEQAQMVSLNVNAVARVFWKLNALILIKIYILAF